MIINSMLAFIGMWETAAIIVLITVLFGARSVEYGQDREIWLKGSEQRLFGVLIAAAAVAVIAYILVSGTS